MYHERTPQSKLLADSRMENFDIDKQFENEGFEFFGELFSQKSELFSKEQLSLIDRIQNDGRKLHSILEKECNNYELYVWLMDCATTSYPSSMMYIDVEKHYFSDDKQKEKLFRYEIVEPYLERNGVNSLIFMNYIDKNIILFAMKHSDDKSLKLFENYFNHLEKNISSFETKVILNEKDKSDIEKTLKELIEKKGESGIKIGEKKKETELNR